MKAPNSDYYNSVNEKLEGFVAFKVILFQTQQSQISLQLIQSFVIALYTEEATFQMQI